MADTKITALTALTAADPANDVIPIVDISDTSMAASGTTKKISINNILACSPSATLASATITGALTVDTTTLVVDPTNDRVGIGTATPAAKLIVRDGSNRNLLVSSDATQLGSAGIAIGSFTDNAAGYAPLSIIAGTSMAFGMNGTTAMTLNSTGLGVGVVPSVAGENIYVRKDQAAYTSIIVRNDNTLASGTGCGFTLIDGGVNAGWFRRQRDGSGNTDIGYKDSLRFRGAITGTERTDMTIDSSGNVGIGVTPSAWGSASYSVAALQNSAGAFWNYQTSIVSMIQNAFYNNSAQYIYKNNGFASEYYQSSGQHIWRTAPSGTAGNAITFTQAMALDASGRLLVGTTVLNASWDTRLTLSSDSGTTRWAVGPYAAPQNFVISSGAATGVYLNGTAATSWTSASDERLKDIIEPISNAVSKVASLRAVIGKFKFDENNTRKPFLIAQDIQAVLPEAVDASNPDQLGVSYTDVIPLLVAAIKELTARVQTLEAK